MADDDSSKDRTLLQKIAGVLLDFYEWTARTLGQERALKALVDDLGGDLKSAPKFPDDFDPDGIKAYLDAENPDLEAWIGVIVDVRRLIESIRSIAEAVDLGPEATTEEVAQSLIDLLASNYVRDRWFHLYVWMEFARFSTEPMTLYGPHGTAAKRFYGSLKALLKFVLAPLSTLAGPPMQTEADARKWSDSTLLHLGGYLGFLGHSSREIGLDNSPADDGLIKAFYGWDQPKGASSVAEALAPAADDISERMLSVQLRSPPGMFDTSRLSVEGALRSTLAWVPAEHGGPGLFVSLGGGSFRIAVDLAKRWVAQAEARFDAPFSLRLGGDKDSFAADASLGEAHADFAIMSRPVPPGEYGFRFSLGGDNGLQIGRVALSAAVDRDSARAQLSLYDCRLALDGSSFDDFIGSLLPRTQTSVEFSFGVGASTRGGVFTTGDLPFASGRGSQGPAPATPPESTPAPDGLPPGTIARTADLPVVSTGVQGGGIPIQIPIGKSIGPVRLQHVLLNLDRDTSGDSPKTLIGAAVSFSAAIGPVTATVDRIGLNLAVDFPEDQSQANMHFGNLEVGFLPPAGIGLVVDTEQVKGGGFLFHDEARHLYAGVMELSLSRIIALKAIGLLSTRMPDGSKGYSLLILVTAENTNPSTSLLELPMGWRLMGVGGLLAIHRTVDEEAIRSGLKNHTLESVLFPKDPVRNAPAVIGALERVFPIRRGSYLFGLIVRLVWGVPTIITLDLGVILEWAGSITPRRLIVLGRVLSILPRPEEDLLRLNLDAVGIFDFDLGTVAIDAVLVDSRLLNRFPLTGSAALRARWTSPRGFALAVGGMHHAFKPPAEFPKLDRLALSLTTGDNPRLTCDAYFAVTSNTVQFGSHALLYAAAYGFNVQGEAGFDVLIRLLPFHFLAEFFAGMQLRKGSRNLFKVKVEGALEGPVPLALRAKCTFEIFWWDVSIRVNVTLAGGAAPPLPAGVDALVQLREALNDARSWSAELPVGQTRVVALRDAAVEGELRAHPLGTLAVRQSVVPLNLSRDIEKFGESPVSGSRRFAVTGVTIGGAQETSNPVDDDFAPAQFFEMSDDDRLGSPSFEPMQAGLRIGSSEFTLGFGERAESPLEYETRIVDRSAAAPAAPPGSYRLSAASLAIHALYGAAGRSALRRERPATAEPFARIEPARWTAVAEGLAPLDGAASGRTFVEALGGLQGTRSNMVVRDFELSRMEVSP